MNEETTQQLPNDLLKLILARLDSIDKRFESTDARLTSLEEKVDRRLQETRPIWEGVLVEIAGLRTTMLEGFEKLRGELSHGLRRVNLKIDVLNHDILEVRADLHYMDERVTKLEPETP